MPKKKKVENDIYVLWINFYIKKSSHSSQCKNALEYSNREREKKIMNNLFLGALYFGAYPIDMNLPLLLRGSMPTS